MGEMAKYGITWLHVKGTLLLNGVWTLFMYIALALIRYHQGKSHILYTTDGPLATVAHINHKPTRITDEPVEARDENFHVIEKTNMPVNESFF